MHADGLERSVVMYMLTCNIFNLRSVKADPLFWPFQYVDNKEDEQLVYTPDYFTEKALTLVQKSTARELLGLTFKDVLEMDYGMYQYLEKLLDELEEARQKTLKELDKKVSGDKDGT